MLGWSNWSGFATGTWPGLSWAMYRPAHRRDKWLFMLAFPFVRPETKDFRWCYHLVGNCSAKARLLQELASHSGLPDLKNENTGHTQVNLNFRSTTNSSLVQVCSVQYLGHTLIWYNIVIYEIVGLHQHFLAHSHQTL